MSPPSPSTDAEALFLSELPVIEDVIRFVCRRHRCRREEAEEFASVARVRLIEEGYAVLRRFEGRSSLRTYLAVVLQRLFLDFRTQRWGKWRPSAAALKMGEDAVRLEALLHRDGRPFEEACEILLTNERRAISRERLLEIAERLPPRVHRREEGEDAVADLGVSAEATEGSLAAREAREQAGRVQAALRRSLGALPPQDRLVLRMRFEEEMGIAEVARALGLEEKPLYKRMDRLLARLRRDLEGEGVGRDDASAVLGLRIWDWSGVFEGGSGPGTAV